MASNTAFKILAISGDDIRNMGGGEKALLNMCQLFEIQIISIQRTQDLYVNAELNQNCSIKFIYTIVFPKLKFAIPLGLFLGLKCREVRKYSHIISFHSNVFSLLYIIMMNKITRKPIVLFLHDPTFFRRNTATSKFYWRIQMFLIRMIPDIHVEMNEQARFLRNKRYFGRICTFPLFFPKKIEKSLIRTNDVFTVLFVGRLDSFQKGVDLLETIIRKSVQKDNSILFHIVGQDYGGMGSVEKVKKKFPANVRYLGRISEAELEMEYMNSSVFVSTSRYETLGLSILEAVNHGLAVIYFNVISLDGVIDMDFGEAVPSFNTDIFSAAIYRLYEKWKADPEQFLGDRISRIKKFEEYFSEISMKQRVIDLLELSRTK